MSIPSVKLFSNNPGGGLVTAMGGINSLANDMLLRKINSVKAQYAPLTTEADINSKNAYARLVGLQPIGKILGNEMAYANVPDSIKAEINNRFLKAGGVGPLPFPQNNKNTLAQIQHNSGNSSHNSFLDNLKNAFSGLIGINPSQQRNNSLSQISSPMTNQQQIQQPPQVASMPSAPNEVQKRPKDGVTVEGEQWYNSKGEPVYAQDVEESGKSPLELEVTSGQKSPKQQTWAETTGNQKGIIEEGKELGKIRAASKKELDQDYQQALQLKQPIDLIGKIITNPRFQNLRNIPGFQKLQMNGKVTFGTPEEKKLIGEFQAAARQIVSATVKGFGGRILASEIPLSESMKLSDNDSIEAMLGKEPVIKAFNEMTLQRSRIASKLMKNYHLDKGEALEQADKMVDGEAIRKKAEMELNPKPTEEDINYMAQKYNTSPDQIRKRLKAKGLL